MGMVVTYRKDDILKEVFDVQVGGIIDKIFIRVLSETLQRPFHVDSKTKKKHVIVTVQLPKGLFQVVINRKRLFSSTTYIFVLWMVGTSMILFGLATIFMRNQVKPIRRLARAADEFGKGRDAPGFKPEGAKEVRQASTAFISMRNRMQRQMTQRIDMLAGVSHDLRTPLTRMKLQLAMAGEGDAVEALKDDVSEMEHMLEGYLAFARGEGDEAPTRINMSKMLNEVVILARRTGATIELNIDTSVFIRVRPNAFKRCLTNLVENANRYATNIKIHLKSDKDPFEIIIDDDGPGIPENNREDVFKPFFRLDDSRNLETGGVGLGLTISRDTIRGHGGDITLENSPLGGVRAIITIPT